MSPIAQRKTSYDKLRSDYDLAFQQLACEVRHLNQQTEPVESDSLMQGQETVSAAYRSYLRRRNDLAEYLLTRRNEKRTTVPEERELLFVGK